MVQTYRYFRVGVIVMFGGLAFSILFESLRTECVQDSISAYYSHQLAQSSSER